MKKVELKKNKYYILILTIFFLFVNLINATYATDNTITQQDIVNYFEKMKSENPEEIVSIEATENSIRIIGEDEQKQVMNLYYDLTTMEFYCEAEFTNEMDYEILELKLNEVLLLPYYGFCAVVDTLEINEKIYQQYATENGLMTNAFLIMGITGNAEEEGVQPLEIINEFDEELITGINSQICKFYSVKLSKTEEEGKTKLRFTLKMKMEEDFSTITEEIQDKTVLITEENADYKITIKVGETYTFDIDEQITGYSLRGDSCIQFSEDKSQITGKAIGTATGIISLGNTEDNYKTIYVKVTEGENAGQNNEQGNLTGNNSIDNTLADKNLPDTGKALLATIISIIICSVIIGYIKYRNLNIK